MAVGDDDFDLSKYILQLSKKIAQLTKDYVGLPFSTSTQLPFSIDARPAPRSKFYGTTRKWKRGDPLIGYYTTSPGEKKMILNLPDGSTMLDLCYPGWEIAIIDESGIDHFLSRRYLFGDYYHHMLTSRPLRQTQGAERPPANSREDDIEAAMARQAEIFKKRRMSLERAAAEQQRRGVPFDAHPVSLPNPDAFASEHIQGEVKSQDQRVTATDASRVLQKISVGSQSVRDSTTGSVRNRIVIQKTFSTGETETIEKSQQSRIQGDIDCDIEKLLATQLYNVFVSPSVTDSIPTPVDANATTGEESNTTRD